MATTPVMGGSADMKWTFAEFTLDTARYELRSAAGVVSLEPQVFDVLEYLVANHNRVVLKDELIERIWPDKDISDATLSSRVMAARRALGDDGRTQRFIKTLHGRGFMFVGAVGDGGGPVADQSPAARPSPQTDRHPPRIDALDAPATSFVGRAAELGRLRELLARPDCRLVSIVGPGGVGKTRLASVVAAQLAGSGVEVVPVKCRSLASADEIPFAVAAALGITLTSDEAADELAMRLRGRRLVLVLDNVEQMAGDAGRIIAPLLLAEGVRLLLTTRQVLALREEWVFMLGGLESNGAAGSGEAVQLFLEREAQALASLLPTERGDAGEAVIMRICCLVDGMPLALELAAALRRYLSREEIAARIEGDPHFLAANISDLPARHRRITALLEESVDRLSVEQARVLLSLSAFEDSFTAEAARHVADARLPVLGELVDRSLLQSQGGWLSLHPLLRQFARENLGPEAVRPLRLSHAEYYAQFLAERAPALEGGGQVCAIQEIRAEFPEVAAAWLHAAASGRIDLLELAAYPLSLFVEIQSRNLEAVGYLDRAIEAARGRDPHLAGQLLVHRGWSLLRTGRLAAARASAEEAELLFRGTGRGPKPGLGRDPVALFSVITWTRGNFGEALALAEDAASRAAERDDSPGLSLALWIQGALLLRKTPLEWRGDADGAGTFHVVADAAERNNFARALAALTSARNIVSDTGERWIAAFVETETGLLAQAAGDLPAAVHHYQRAMSLHCELDNRRGMASVLLRLANVYLELGDIATAESLLDQAEPLATTVGDDSVCSDYWQSRASLAMARRDFEATFSCLRACVSLAINAGFNANVIAGLRQYGEAIELMGSPERALPIYRRLHREAGMTGFSRARCEASLRRLAPLVLAPPSADERPLLELAHSMLAEVDHRQWPLRLLEASH